MKKVAFVLLLLWTLGSGSAEAAWARVTSATASASGNATVGVSTFPTITLGAAVSVGDRIHVVTAVYNNDTTSKAGSLTDNLGNTYSKDFSARIDGSIAEIAFWSAPVTTGGTPTITGHLVDAGGSPTNFVSTSEYGLAAGAYSGLSTATGTSAIDISITSTAVANPASSGTSGGTTTAANELVLGLYGDDGWNTTMAAGTGYSLFASTGASIYEQAFIEDKDSGASGSTVSATVNNPGSAFFVGAVVYKLAGGGGGATLPHNLPMLGIGGELTAFWSMCEANSFRVSAGSRRLSPLSGWSQAVSVRETPLSADPNRRRRFQDRRTLHRG
jgi:hypothetical protein